jgi:glycosyltransferase involved in cell wall biosynthesis
VADLDEQEFTAKIVRLLTVAKLRERLSREAREYAAEWGARSMAERMVEFYRAVCERRRRAATADGPVSAAGA